MSHVSVFQGLYYGQVMLDPAFYVSAWYQTQVLVFTQQAQLLSYLLALFFFFFETHYIDQDDFELRDSTAFTSEVLVQKCAPPDLALALL